MTSYDADLPQTIRSYVVLYLINSGLEVHLFPSSLMVDKLETKVLAQ